MQVDPLPQIGDILRGFVRNSADAILKDQHCGGRVPVGYEFLDINYRAVGDAADRTQPGAALAFDAVANKALPKRGNRLLRDQLERASTSIILCIAEGAGRRSGPDKRRFYEMARGSATESAAILDILTARGLLSAEAHTSARNLLVRIVQMLTRMSGAPRDP